MHLNLLVLLDYCQDLHKNDFWEIEHLNTLDKLMREPAYVFLEMVSILLMIW